MALPSCDIFLPDVLRSRQVCISPVATGHTSEVQTNTVLPSNMTTPRASLRRIGRIDDRGAYAFLGQLIAGLELHRPIGPPTNLLFQVLTLLKRGLSDIAKVLEHDHPSIELDGILGQGLRSNMQQMFRNGPFAVCQTLQQTSGRPGTYGLNLGPSLSNTFSQVVKFSPREEERCRVRGVRGNKHSLDAGIYSYYTTLSSRFRDSLFIGQYQVKAVFNFLKFRILPGIGWNRRMIKGYGLAPKSNSPIFPFIKVPFPDQGKSGILIDCQFPSFIGFGCVIGSSNMLAKTASKLGGKLKLFSKSTVMSMGEVIRVQHISVENDWRKPIKGLKVIFDYLRGFIRAFDFNFTGSYSFHWRLPVWLQP